MTTAEYLDLTESEKKQIAYQAEHLLGFLKQNYTLDISYDENGVLTMARFIETLRKHDIPEDEIDEYVEAITYFLGETIVKNFSAKWVIKESELALLMQSGLMGFPFTKVRKQFQNGSDDNISTFYRFCKSRALQ